VGAKIVGKYQNVGLEYGGKFVGAKIVGKYQNVGLESGGKFAGAKIVGKYQNVGLESGGKFLVAILPVDTCMYGILRVCGIIDSIRLTIDVNFRGLETTSCCARERAVFPCWQTCSAFTPHSREKNIFSYNMLELECFFKRWVMGVHPCAAICDT